MSDDQRSKVDAAWVDYRRTRSVRDRNRLVELHAPLVRGHAIRIHSGLPKFFQLADLVSAGNVGLIGAVERFDHARGVSFETFAARNVRGAMLDELRRVDFLPRHVRDSVDRVRIASETMAATHGRPPTDCEIARQVHLPASDVAAVQRAAGLAESLHQRRQWDDENASPDQAARRERIDHVASVLASALDRAERLFVVMHYHEGITLRSIAATLGIDVNRAKHLHAVILSKLRPVAIA